MFGLKKVKNGNGENQVPNIIAQGTSVTGDLVSNGDFRIDGVLKGTITASGRIVVGETGEVEGDISCQNADISGSITGNLNVKELAVLKQSSRFNGNIHTVRLTIEAGALFSGQCNMDSALDEAAKVNKK